MSFFSGNFLALVLAALLGCTFFERRWQREVIFSLANLVFVASFFSSLGEAAPLLGFSLAGYLLLLLNRKSPGSWVCRSSVVGIVILFLVLRKYSLVPPLFCLSFSYPTIGMSYLLFRILHLVLESESLSKSPSVPDFFNYLFSFLTFVSGPIQRFDDFKNRHFGEHSESSEVRPLAALGRIFSGYCKIFIVAEVFHDIQKFLWTAPSGDPRTFLIESALTFSCYTLFLFFNFSGYMDVVIGVGQLFGLSLPENFNHPFASRNFLEFWGRWHITLSDWFKTYVFNPLAQFLARRWSSRTVMPYLGVFSFFVTFLIMGIWHGSTSIFIIYGFYLGLGVAINKIYQIRVRGYLGKERQAALTGSKRYQAFCGGLTFAYFTVGLSCLWLTPIEFFEFFRRIGMFGFVAELALIAAIFIVCQFLGSLVLSTIKVLFPEGSWTRRSPVLENLSVCFKVYLIVLSVFWRRGDVPEFVYRAF